MRSFMGVEELTDEWLRVQSEHDKAALMHDGLSLAASVSVNVVAGKLKTSVPRGRRGPRR